MSVSLQSSDLSAFYFCTLWYAVHCTCDCKIKWNNFIAKIEVQKEKGRKEIGGRRDREIGCFIRFVSTVYMKSLIKS